MPNRMPEYPEYEEAIRKNDVNAAYDTAHMLDQMVSRREMRKFVSDMTEEEMREWEAQNP